MKAVFKHEFYSYFTSLTGYIFSAFILLFAGIYSMVYNLKNGIANFEYVMGSMSFIFLIIIPIITMRILSEEKRQKTDQLLYSLPISMTEVVLGKYFAMMLLMLCSLVLIGIYPLVLSIFGDVNLLAAYTAIIGFLFLGAALAAIGMFISSLTESQAISAGVCFIVMLLNYFIADLSSYVSSSAAASLAAFTVVVILVAIIVNIMTKNRYAAVFTGAICEAVLVVLFIFKKTGFEGLFATVMEKLSLFEHFYTMVDGIFDLTGIIYLISVAAVFVFLSIQAMEKRRWS